MGMYGEWLRLSPAELERAKADLGWALELAQSISKAEYQSEPAPDLPHRRSFGTDKTWHALEYLLDRHDFPVDIIGGEACLVEDYDPEEEDSDADWGYGPPGYLTAEQVRQAARALAELDGEDLIRGIDQSELERENIYPQVWDRPGELPWAVSHLPHVKEWFGAAARHGDAVLCWIS